MNAARALCFAAIGAWACAGTQPAAELPLSDEALRASAARIQSFAGARGDVELVEGGLEAAFYTWRIEERFEDGMFDPGVRGAGGRPVRLPRLVRERVLVGPETRVVGWKALQAVRVHRWLIGSGVELDVVGEPEPLLLRVPDDEAAPLAEALDLIRRAQRR